MEKKREFRINTGASLIILLIVVFALSIFAVLSIKASNSDLILAKKTRTATSQYYQADSKAEEYLARINVLLDKREAAVLTKGLLELDCKPVLTKATLKTGTIRYQVPINENASLQVELTYDFKKPTGVLYDIRTWKVEQKAIGDYDFSDFQFWDGTIEEE